MERNQVFVEREERDSDGYWIYLRAGWRVIGGDHAIVEDTKAAARSKLSLVKECDCDECRRAA